MEDNIPLNPRQADAQEGFTEADIPEPPPSNPRQADAQEGFTEADIPEPPPSNPRQEDDQYFNFYEFGEPPLPGEPARSYAFARTRRGFRGTVEGFERGFALFGGEEPDIGLIYGYDNIGVMEILVMDWFRRQAF